MKSNSTWPVRTYIGCNSGDLYLLGIDVLSSPSFGVTRDEDIVGARHEGQPRHVTLGRLPIACSLRHICDLAAAIHLLPLGERGDDDHTTTYRPRGSAALLCDEFERLGLVSRGGWHISL